MGLNPFGTGQCLSTVAKLKLKPGKTVSIPLEQGNVFRLKQQPTSEETKSLNPFGTGQCLSTGRRSTTFRRVVSLNPFGTGQCLSTR